jgi:hypothetical protein
MIPAMRLLLLWSLFTLSPPAAMTGHGAPAGPQDGLAKDLATITGSVISGSKTPLPNCIVLIYAKQSGPPPHPFRYWRIPDLISAATPDGSFSVQVPAGTYYLMAAQKNPTDPIGPPTKSELIYLHADATGTARPLHLASGERLNLGRVTATPWLPEQIQRDQGITAVKGIVVDQKGTPVANAVVFASLTKGTMGRPTFISERTDTNGQFLLRVSGGGIYYLKVRSVLGGGAPQTGEFLNTTEEFTPLEITLQQDQIRQGVTLTVKKFSRAGGAGDDRRRETEKPPVPSRSADPSR